ncbi:MAG TPA: hypothetical protein VHO25_22815, partial [Polyangiaceae bacterium]|nr:hypothetical protein [Polyangiaceae bacterium]
IAGHGPTLHQGRLPSTLQLEVVAAIFGDQSATGGESTSATPRSSANTVACSSTAACSEQRRLGAELDRIAVSSALQ